MSATEYFDSSGAPSTGSQASSAVMRAEFDLVQAGFGKLPDLAGNGSKAVVINAGGSAMTVTTGTLTLAGNFATSGSSAITLTSTGATNVTLPTTGTLATLAGGETLTNKTVNLASNTLTGTVAQFNAALSDGDFATLAGAESLTNKTLGAGCAWNGNVVTVTYGGTGVATLTGLAYGNGTSAFTAASAAQIVSAIGSTAVTNATNATNVSGGTVSATTGTFTGLLTSAAASVGSDQSIVSRNTDNTNSASRAYLQAVVAGASGGDPFLLLTVTGATEWSVGVDNSDSDTLKIGNSSVIGSSTLFSLTTAGAATVAAGLNATTGGITASSGRLIQSVNNATGFADAGIQAISNTGDVYIAWHASGATATVLKHVRGGQGLELRDASNALTSFLAGPITANSFIPAGSAAPNIGMYKPVANYLSFATQGIERVTISDTGMLYGLALHNNATLPTGTAAQAIASGTYTPTLTNVLNVTGSTPKVCQWVRVGNVVTVSGHVNIDPTSASSPTQLDISLPIPSNFIGGTELAGTGCHGLALGVAGSIRLDVANDRAIYEFVSNGSAANVGHVFHFTYLIL